MSRWESLRRAVRLPSVERDVDDEIRFHLESRVRDLAASGHAPDDARRIAEHEFGDLHAARHELAAVDRKTRRHATLADWRDAFAHDLRFSLRSLASSRGLAAMVVVLLALGVGANAATFAVADQLFRQPPAGVAKPDDVRRLVLRTNWSVGHVTTIRAEYFYPAFRAVADAIGSRASLAGYSKPDSADARLGGTRGFTRISYVTPEFFSVLAVRATRGRFFTAAEGTMGAGEPVAVISHDIWQTRFDADESAIGKPIEIAGQRFTIIGVAAEGFTGVDLDRADVWLPFALFPWPAFDSPDPWYRKWRMNLSVRVLARLAPGSTGESIAAIATPAYRRGEIANVKGGADSTGVVLAAPLLESLGPSIKPAAQTAITTRLIGVALIVLVVACANVANLLLLRGSRRRREIAVRLALGISRRRLVRQILLESVLLSLAAAAAAIVVGAWGGAFLRSMMLPSVHWATGTLSARLVFVAVGVALVTGVASGLAPALRPLDGDLTTSLKSSARDGVVKRSRLRVAFIVLQAALSVVLLVGAGLFIRSLSAVRSIDVGYDADQIAFGFVSFRDPKGHFVDHFSGAYVDEIAAGLTESAQRLARAPSIEGVALSSVAPMAGYGMIGLYTADRQPVPHIANRDPALLRVSPGYLGVVGVRVVRGRLFTAADETNGDGVIIVNETAARTYWPGRDALGQCLIVARLTSPCSTVIGVSRDAHLETIVEGPVAELFQPMRRGDRELAKPKLLVVRARAGQTRAAAGELRRELERTFPTAEPPYVRTVAEEREPELRPWRLGATLFTMFGVLALVVATIGVYSVMAFSVSQRTHEMGVRLALGAREAQVARLIVGQGVWPIAAGVLIGVLLSLALGRFVADMLYGTTPGDPLVLGGVCLLLVGSGAFGALVPAWRATRVNPVIALRAE